MTKYVVVTGGVLSGLGKGITASSIGMLLKARGVSLTAVKIDPYLNSDAGTMNPFEHGEVFVLNDGGEVDLDLGNYERFLDIPLSRENNITTGKVYKSVIDKERRGDYLGKTVQIVPHVTNEIREWIKRVAKSSGADVCLVEVGGTVGDIESAPFLEAIRQLHREVGHENLFLIHTSLVPVVGSVGEQKTKPTQHTVRDLKSIGLHPDMIVCRSAQPLAPEIREKIASFCDVDESAVVSAHDARSIYEVPLILEEQGVPEYILARLGMSKAGAARAAGASPGAATNGSAATKLHAPDLVPWRDLVDRILNPQHEVTVAFVGKYTDLSDSYLSINEALRHAGASLDTRVRINYIEGEDLEEDDRDAWRKLREADAILVGPGFGSRGTEGKIRAVHHARDGGVPFLGICLGFQLAIVEYARNECHLAGANSTEMDPDAKHPVICILPEQYEIQELGGTMRLGSYECVLAPGSLAADTYGATVITERHRHRYEMNPEYISKLEAKGMVFSGRMPDRPIMEVMELPRDVHPYFIGGQFHPEFNSRPQKPGPLFVGLVQAALVHKGVLNPGPEPVAAA